MMAVEKGARIIGGMFGLERPQISSQANPEFISKSHLFLINGRSAFSLLICRLSPARVWLPSYLCGSIVDALHGSVLDLDSYEVNYDLKVGSAEWVESVRPGVLVVLIDYFGFRCFDDVLASRIKAQRAWILEDACQSLLSDVGPYSDFVVYSPRKFVGVPDGGILAVNSKIDIDNLPLKPPPTEWWLKSFRASILRREYDHYGTNRAWFDLFQESESHCPIGCYSMSELSK